MQITTQTFKSNAAEALGDRQLQLAIAQRVLRIRFEGLRGDLHGRAVLDEGAWGETAVWFGNAA
jgi:hypothetical protein